MTLRPVATAQKCGGLYVASVQHGAHTRGEYWVYVEAPINSNDEGPLALWAAKVPEGPFSFRAYVLDGGVAKGAWDSGRYSESRVWFFNGLFHLFATGRRVSPGLARATRLGPAFWLRIPMGKLSSAQMSA
jgi:hypothetical protein